MAVLVVLGVKERGLTAPKLVISDANPGLAAAIRKGLLGAAWQRCKVHFMGDILAHVPQKEKQAFSKQLKSIWQAPAKEQVITKPQKS